MDEERYGKVYEYDLAGRVIRVTDPEGGTTRYEYSQYGELIKHTDAMGNITQYEYDNAGKLVKVTDALGISTKYTYDKAGNKLTMTDGRGKLTAYAYGSFGLLTSYTDADRQKTGYKYDLSLAVASMTDRNGNETRYSYDNRGLLTEKRVEETGDTVAYTYDVLGSREAMTDDTGTSTYSYNENNWLTSIEKDGEPQLSYDYDEIGNIKAVTDKLGNITEYTYDKSSRMKTVSFGSRTAAYEYDDNGNRKSISYDGEVEENYSYDKNNRLLKLINKKAGGSEISSYSYTYDLAGRQTSKTDSYGTTKYTYDKAGRILRVEAPGKTTAYTYDGAGNRISQDETYTSEQIIPAIDGTGIGEIKYIVKRSEYIYSNASRLLKLVEKMKDGSGVELLQRITTFGYDSNGNEQRRSVEYISLFNKANPKAYEVAVYNEDTTEPIHAVVEQTVSKYDGFNRLTRTEIIKATVKTTVEYAYNGDGLRVEKIVRRSNNGNTAEVTTYLYDRQHVILETRGSEEIRYVRGINYIARIDGTDKLSYYLYNGHGDVVQTVSEAGEIENQYDYDIFGNPTLTVESYLNSIRYAGEFYDSETGLYYLRARYYDPYIGRFISEDSYWGEDANPLSLNLYTYCHNDPIQFIDPTGHYDQWDADREWGDYDHDGVKDDYEDNDDDGDSDDDGTPDWTDPDSDDYMNPNTPGYGGGSSSKSRHKGRSSGSGNSSVSTPDYSQEAAAIEAKAKLKLELTGKENSKVLQQLLEFQKELAEAAYKAGNVSEAEAYSKNAVVLLAKLKVQQEREIKAEFLLSIGDKGSRVEELQRLLIGAGITNIPIEGKIYILEPDGDFGKITAEAVRMYQRKKGLTVDGVVGAQTMKNLYGSNYNKYAEILDKMQSGKGQYNNDDVEVQRPAGVADGVSAQETGNDSRTLPGNAGMEGKETGNSQTSSVIKIPELYTKSTTKTLTGLDAWKQIGSTTVEMVGNTAQVGFYVAVSSGATAMTGPGGALVTAAIAEEVARNTAQAGYGSVLVVSSIIYTINDGGFDYTEITLTDPNGNSNELLDKVINLPSVSPIKK